MGIPLIPKSSNHSHENGNSQHQISIEEWEAQKHKFRVVASDGPISLSSGTWEEAGSEMEELFEVTIRPFIPYAFHRNGILYPHAMGLYYCYPPGDEANGKYVIAMETLDENTETWPRAADQILTLFKDRVSQNELSDAVGKLAVEIYNPELVYALGWLPPSLDDNALTDAMDGIEEPLLGEACTYLEGSFASIDWRMRINCISHPRFTFIVFCHPGSFCNFKEAEERLMRILRTAPVRMYLEIRSE